MNSMHPLTKPGTNSSLLNQTNLPFFALIIIGYLIGSINSAIIICKIYGLPSPRSIGSNNPGATNVMRIGGKKLAVLTFFADAFKGFIPIIICHFIFDLPNIMLAVISLSIIVGHMFPVFFGFRGGKGVATFFGCLIAINLWVAVLTMLSWFIVAKPLKISALAAIVACILCPLYSWIFISGPMAIAIAVICIIIICKHHDNIKRLLTGKESNFK